MFLKSLMGNSNMSVLKESTCEICGGELCSYAESRLYDADGNKVKNASLRVCRVCGTGVTFPQPSKDSLSAFYSEGVYEKAGGRGQLFVSAILNWLQRQRVREIERYSNNTGRLLDVGCGKGRFVTVANRIGWQGMGQDFSCSQAGFATRRSGARVWCGDLKEFKHDNQFDVVSAWHVLEHTHNPADMISTMRSLTAKDGVVAIEVPNFQSWQSFIGKGRWFQSDVPRHLWHFSSEGLERLLENNGFKVLATRTFSLELGFFGMLQTLLNVTGFEPQWLFRYLKRTVRGTKPLKVGVNVLGALALLMPAVVLELISVIFRRGGVVRCVARRVS